MKKFKKRFGQNFITNKKLIKEFVDVLEIQNTDNIIEIGTGDGRVTMELLKKEPKNLISIEIDNDLIPFLQEKFIGFKNFRLIHKDILKLDLNSLDLSSDYKVIGSLPYNISKKIIEKFMLINKRPFLMNFIVQKEVAESYIAKTSKNTFLSLFTDLVFSKKVIKTINPNNFYPKPKVDSAIIVFQIKKQPLISDTEELKKFRKFLLNAFRSPRKMLKNVLNSIYRDIDFERILKRHKIDLKNRAENLSVEDYLKIYNDFLNQKS